MRGWTVSKYYSIRFEKKAINWMALTLIAFTIRFLRKIKNKVKS